MIRSREFRVESLEQRPAGNLIALAGYKFLVITLGSKLSALDSRHLTLDNRLSTEHDDIY